MSSDTYFLERKYITIYGNRLSAFKAKGNDVYMFRCPLCGDSKRNRKKARGFLFPHKGIFFFKCHNCNEVCSFLNLMKKTQNSIYRAFMMENLKNGRNSTINISRNVNTNVDVVPSEAIILDALLDRIDRLPNDHFCVKYVAQRKIPKDKWKYLYFIDDMSKMGNLKEKYKKVLRTKEARLVIPFFNEIQQLTFIQARDLSGKSKSKYITLDIKEDHNQVYGMDRVDRSKKIYLTEGPLDSLFFENGIAAATSDLTRAARFFHKEQIIMILDNQPRNSQIVKLYKDFAEQGYKVFVWPEDCKVKDINEFVQGASEVGDWNYAFVKDYVDKCTYSGIQLNLKLQKWIKI